MLLLIALTALNASDDYGTDESNLNLAHISPSHVLGMSLMIHVFTPVAFNVTHAAVRVNENLRLTEFFPIQSFKKRTEPVDSPTTWWIYLWDVLISPTDVDGCCHFRDNTHYNS